VKLSIIIVGWNVCDDLVRCLRSVERHAPSEPCEVIVIDNASVDGTVDTVRREFPHVTVLANGENRGFAAANNQGLARATGRYILLLNPDTVVRTGALDTMIQYMEVHEDVGVCGPLLLNSDGSIQASVRRFPNFRSALYRNTIFRNIGLFRTDYRRFMMCDFTYDRLCEVDQVMGAALMTRRSVVEQIGRLDERFFMYFEEVDFCYRVRRAGWRVTFIPQAQITHRGQASAEQIPVAAEIMMLTSMVAYFRRHRGPLATAGFNILFKPAFLLRHVVQIAGSVPMYVFGWLVSKRETQHKSAMRIRNSVVLLSRHSWRVLFRM
jgi:GT2 family glycosyltransferase